MHTQCPYCQTVFNVTAGQLRLAHGRVRCGQCLNVFDGLQGLGEDAMEEPTTPHIEASQMEDPVATVEQHGDRALLRAIPKSQWTVAVPDTLPDDPAPGSEYADTIAQPYNTALANVYPDILSEVGAPGGDSPGEVSAQESTEATEPEVAGTEVLEAFPHEERGEASLVLGAAIASVGVAEEGRYGGDTEAVALVELPGERLSNEHGEVTDEAIEQVGSIVPTLPTDASEDEIGEPIDIETLRAFEAQVEASMHGDPLNETSAEPDHPGSVVEPGDDIELDPIYPKILEDDIARLERLAANARARKALAVSSVGLLVVLALQYAWFMPADMASRYPQARSFLGTFCRYAACTLPEQRNPSLVQVVSRDVRVHPKYEGALLVTAQLVNAADFVQPYPLMEFTLFNVNGQTIATRTFAPEEYVGPSVDISAGMKPAIPTQIELDVLAPDEAAVSFEFRFL